MKKWRSIPAGLFALAVAGAGSGADDITWLVSFDGKGLPLEQGWRSFGEVAAKAGVVGGSIRIVDDSPTALGYFRAAWTPDFSREVLVEVKVPELTVTLRTAPRQPLAQQFLHDDGKMWGVNQVISAGHGFNWSSVCEVSPGRLLNVHDDGRLRAVYVDIERPS